MNTVPNSRVSLISLVNLKRAAPSTTATATVTASSPSSNTLIPSSSNQNQNHYNQPVNVLINQLNNLSLIVPSSSSSSSNSNSNNSSSNLKRKSVRSKTLKSTVLHKNHTNNQLRLFNNLQPSNQYRPLILRNLFTQPSHQNIVSFFDSSSTPSSYSPSPPASKPPSSSSSSSLSYNSSSHDCVCFYSNSLSKPSSPNYQNHHQYYSPRNTHQSSSSSSFFAQSTQTESQNDNHQSSSSSSSSSTKKTTRSIGSNLSVSQFNALNLYSNSLDAKSHQTRSNPKLVSPKKTFYLFRNGASGIPKSSTGNSNLFLTSSSSTPAISSSSSSSSSPSPSSSSDSVNHQSRTLKQKGECCSVQVGEDSYFLRSDSLGVADGVGGWSGKPGANAGLFSSKLMHHCSTEIARYEDTNDVKFLSYNQADPVEVLQYAFEKSIYESKDEGILGSSTALVAILRNDELRIANIGDCCCSIIRGNDYIFRTEEQQHSFNYPVQIGTNSKSFPIKDAQRYKVKVQKDDIVILSSDGLVDNLFDEDILEEVLKFTKSLTTAPEPSSTTTTATKEMMKDEGGQRREEEPRRATKSGESPNNRNQSKSPSQAMRMRRKTMMMNSVPELISKSLCLKAKTVIEDQQAITSPFAQRASEEGIHYVGGKNDDISVLVAIVGALES